MQLAILVCWPRPGARAGVRGDNPTPKELVRCKMFEAMQSDDKTGGQHFDYKLD